MFKSKINEILKFFKDKVKSLNVNGMDAEKRKIIFAKVKKNYIWILLGVLVTVFVLTRTVGKIKQVFFGKKEV